MVCPFRVHTEPSFTVRDEVYQTFYPCLEEKCPAYYSKKVKIVFKTGESKETIAETCLRCGEYSNDVIKEDGECM